MPILPFNDVPGDLIGAHLSTRGGLETVFARAQAIGASSVALFAKNSSQWKGKTLTDQDVECFRRERSVLPLFTHASYLINLASPSPEFHTKSVDAMVDELDRAERLGVQAVVLHPGAHVGTGPAAGLEQIARSIDEIHIRIPTHQVVTLLETAAGQGSCLGCSFEELGKIIDSVDDPSRLGVCFDTCHVFASGYDLRTRDSYMRAIDDLDRAVGLERVGAFHLNDSKKGLGSRVDRHEHIGEGELGIEAFRLLLNDSRFARVPKLLETPKTIETESDRRNIGLLRSLISA